MTGDRRQDGAPAAFEIEVEAGVAGDRRFTIVSSDRSGAERRREYWLHRIEQSDYADFFGDLARDFGTRIPRNRLAPPRPAERLPCRALLTHNLSPQIRYGYGDPALLWVPEELLYYCVVTSNDAPHSFPILRSPDLENWQMAGFVFPPGEKPSWAAEGEHVGDYWAPELHKVGDEYLICFAAREKTRSLAIGIATARHPQGPFTTSPNPLLRGEMIDPHIFVERSGSALLLWKEDSNGRWPRLIARLLGEHDWLAAELFDAEEDRRTAALARALWPWAEGLEPMEQFFILQPLIEAVVANFGSARERLEGIAGRLPQLAAEIEQVLQAMRTPIYAQRLSADLRLEGERHVLMVNDLEWEGHLIEGPWLIEQDGRFYLFYSGNDFSTADYGVGVAVADTVLGPYRKMPEPLLRSGLDWTGPGHPSVAPGRDGSPHMFLHAYVPGAVGYKAFRALLATRLCFTEGGVTLERPG